MEKTMKARVQHKHDLESNWLKATNFTPLVGEIIVYDPDENYDYPRIKIGDGETNINSLPFITEDYAKIADIPTKPADIGAQPAGNYLTSIPSEYITESELNARGYLTDYTESDPTVPAWAKAATKPTYTASEVGALPSTTKIPSTLSELGEDSTHRVVTDTEKAAWNAKSNFSGSYNDLSDKPTIPSTDGLASTGYVDNAVKDKVDKDGNKVLSTNDYTTAEKNKLAGIAAGAEVNVNADWNATSGDAQILNKPTLGTIAAKNSVAKTDLVSEVQTSLGKADTALQPGDISDWAKQPNKPSYTANEVGALPSSTKIPAKTSDLTNDSGFITGYTETDPTVPSWAKAATKPTYTASEVGALPSTTKIPSALSDLTTDTTHRVVTDVEKNTWNAKAEASAIPTKVSQLDNDSKFLTSFTETDPTVPAWAKASSKPSYTKSEVGLGNVDNVKQYSANNPPVVAQATAPSDTSVVWVDTDDNTVDELQDAVNLALAQAKESGEFTPVKGVDYWTTADQEDVVQQVIIALRTPVFGTIDANNIITLTGVLAEGAYTIKYEDSEGNVTEIGTLNTNSGPSYINWIPKAINADGTIYNGVGYQKGIRYSASSGTETTTNAEDIYSTGLIPAKAGDVIYMKNITLKKASSIGNAHHIYRFPSLSLSNGTSADIGATPEAWQAVWDGAGVLTQCTIPTDKTISYIRIQAEYIGPDSILTINEPIE